MGNGMNRILPGLYVGSIRDSNDKEQLIKNNITHILTIHDDPKPQGAIEHIKYLRFKAQDNSRQNIKKFFDEAIEFIHEARINNGCVLVHCLAGVSRSASLSIAYIMTITELPWYDSMNSVRGARKQTNPNFGFQRQLQNFEHTTVKQTRENLYKKYGHYDNSQDLAECQLLLKKYKDSQAELNSFPANKTYPLAFNAYKLDEEKEENQKKDNESPELLDENVTEIKSTEETEKQKEDIFDKIFS